MQDRYAGDIGDFGKYGLLRALCGDGGPRLGMAWWMTQDEEQTNDGNMTAYLERREPGLWECDPELFEALARMVREGNRTVAGVAALGVLPPDTLHHTDVLRFAKGSHRLPRGRDQHSRQTTRTEWLLRAHEALTDAEVVFIDPDNGISETADPLSPKGPKHVFPDELGYLANPDRSIIVYHHIGRRGTAAHQLELAARVLQQATGQDHRPWTLWYHRGTARGYLISPSDEHRKLFRTRTNQFLQGPWWKHFEETRRESPQ